MTSTFNDVVEPSRLATFLTATPDEYAREALEEDSAPFSTIGALKLFAYRRHFIAGNVVLKNASDQFNQFGY